jgi:hypothetical protein
MSELPPPLPQDPSPGAATPPPLPSDPDINYQSSLLVDRDTEHLKILSVCWYVVSGLSVLFGCFPLLYVGMGVMMMTTPRAFAGGAPPPPPAIGLFFALFGGFFSLMIWVGAVLAFLTGRALTNRNRLILCYVTAGLACLQIPIGTILGIFTFVILARPTVRSKFP